MPLQDRTGTKYEKILAASLLHLGYEYGGDSGNNYLHPKKREPIPIPGTFIKPDFVVRHDTNPFAILYATHWSETRSSKKKFWRTWEEAAQQKIILGSKLLTINCIFEALPRDFEPAIYITSDDIPKDATRSKNVPIQFNGWDPGIGWAMVEAFDVSLVFPVEYNVVDLVAKFDQGDHDNTTSELLQNALAKSTKTYYEPLWQILRKIRKCGKKNIATITSTQSRYRIGLLHLYLFYRLIQKLTKSKVASLEKFITSLVGGTDCLDIEKISRLEFFSGIEEEKLINLFNILSGIYVRKGEKAKNFCTISEMSHSKATKAIRRITFNDDLNLCLQDLAPHVDKKSLFQTIERIFNGFDQRYGVDEALDDLVDIVAVKAKEKFVRQTFLPSLSDQTLLNDLLQKHAKNLSPDRKSVSSHNQNWVFEMILYLTGLNSSEDIQKRFKQHFETSGHKLRPHAPYGGHAQTVAFLLQGRDICEQWKVKGGKRTLTPDEFYALAWKTVSVCIAKAFKDRQCKVYDSEEVIKKYLENKSMRIISSDLNGFYIMVELYLGDICTFTFTDTESVDSSRICPSWQTDMINEVWGGRPLETWLEGVSKNGKWLIKVQSSQDGHEADKAKELAGRSRGIHSHWTFSGRIRTRSKWKFKERNIAKMALVLDGDWNAQKKQNLYESGWDWVGDVSELETLRKLIEK